MSEMKEKLKALLAEKELALALGQVISKHALPAGSTLIALSHVVGGIIGAIQTDNPNVDDGEIVSSFGAGIADAKSQYIRFAKSGGFDDIDKDEADTQIKSIIKRKADPQSWIDKVKGGGS